MADNEYQCPACKSGKCKNCTALSEARDVVSGLTTYKPVCRHECRPTMITRSSSVTEETLSYLSKGKAMTAYRRVKNKTKGAHDEESLKTLQSEAHRLNEARISGYVS